MDIFSCQEAFGAADKTTAAMRQALSQWQELYYRDTAADGEDPCQRIAYTVVSKLVRTVFSEYSASGDTPFAQQVLAALDQHKETAVQLALVGGACYLKPWIKEQAFGFTLIPRDRILIFARDPDGVPTDVGTMERCTQGSAYYTLLERRTVDEQGFLTIENRLYRAYNADMLGQQVSLGTLPCYRSLAQRYTFARPVGSVGLVQLRTPMLNCVDGSADPVSVYAAATGLIHAIDRNEYQLMGEFDRGESRVFASSDLLDADKALSSTLFVGLDESPEQVGLTVFSPNLREQSFLNRKQEYLRNVESVIGLKRGMLSDVNISERTATEISASQAEHSLTVMDFQAMWEKAVRQAVSLCAVLGALYGVPGASSQSVSIDWGNGVLYDEDKLWQDYKEMVSAGLIRPEIALGWRFGMPADTPQQLAAIREKYMPQNEKEKL